MIEDINVFKISSFNRYMVECEYTTIPIRSNDHIGFNRYMVECELKHMKILAIVLSSFNRYMVECELFQ